MQVLVETFEEGELVTHIIRAPAKAAYKPRLAELGSQTMLQMLLVDNLIHSDLHPGVKLRLISFVMLCVMVTAWYGLMLLC